MEFDPLMAWKILIGIFLVLLAWVMLDDPTA